VERKIPKAIWSFKDNPNCSWWTTDEPREHFSDDVIYIKLTDAEALKVERKNRAEDLEELQGWKARVHELETELACRDTWARAERLERENKEFLEWAEAVRYMAINGVLCDPIDPCNLCKPIWDAYPVKG
jgi:hypothetical protein